MFEIFEQPAEIRIDRLQKDVFVTLLCGGIVNPFGPTLTAAGFLGNPTGRVDLVELMLNPFAQEVHQVGRATINERWNLIDDCDSVIRSCSLRGCPTLILPGAGLEDWEAREIHARWLCRFQDAGHRWKMIQAHPYDPWTRIDEEMKDGFAALDPKKASAHPQSPLTKAEALDFAGFVLSDQHTMPELQAFMGAWKGSIGFQSQSGDRRLAQSAMPLDGFHPWFSLIAATCRLPAKLRS